MRRGLRLLRLRTRPGQDVGAVPTGRRRAQQRQIHHPARGVLGPDAGRLDSRFHLGDFARDQFLGRGAQVGAPPHLPFLQARQLDLRQQHDDDVGLPGRYRVGQVEYLVKKMKREIGRDDAVVVATGGMARMIASETRVIDQIDGLLTLKGLRLIYERNAEG